MPNREPQKIIEAQTAAVATQELFLVTREKSPCRITAPGLAGAEEVDLWQSVDGGTNWVTYKDSAGTALKLTATIDSLEITAPVVLGVTKDATASAVGVFVFAGL